MEAERIRAPRYGVAGLNQTEHGCKAMQGRWHRFECHLDASVAQFVGIGRAFIVQDIA